MKRLEQLYPLLSVVTLLLLWQAASTGFNSTLLPPPLTVVTVLIDTIKSGELPYNLGITLLRLVISFTLSMVFGIAIGIAMGLSSRLNHFFDSWLIIFLNIPALVSIILCYVWFGLVETAAILAVVINKLPNVVVTLREGTRTLDRNLLEMAQSYHFGRWKTFRHVIWPQLFPFVMAAARSGLALIWKIILVVELLGRSNGMGYQLHLYFQLFDVSGILAYTIAFIVVIQLIEGLLLKPLDHYAQRWKR